MNVKSLLSSSGFYYALKSFVNGFNVKMNKYKGNRFKRQIEGVLLE